MDITAYPPRARRGGHWPRRPQTGMHRCGGHATAPAHRRQHSELSPLQDVPIFVGKGKVKTNLHIKIELGDKGLIQTVNIKMVTAAPGCRIYQLVLFPLHTYLYFLNVLPCSFVGSWFYCFKRKSIHNLGWSIWI